MTRRTVTVDVEVDLSEFETADLQEELDDRGESFQGAAKPHIERAFEAYRTGNLRALDAALRDLFDSALGRVAGASPFEVHA